MFATYEMEILTPVHIGSGCRILPLEYVLDRAQGKFVRVNMEALFRDRNFDSVLPRYINEVGTPGFRLYQFYPQACKFSCYELVTDQVGLAELESLSEGHVQAGIRDSCGWYVPGSSLKGALRTLVYKANMDGALAQTLSNKIAEKLADHKTKKEWATSAAEQALTGNPHFSLFRVVKIGDSSVVDSADVGLFVAKVLSMKKGTGHSWKGFSKGNVYNPSAATPLFFEALQPKVKLSGKFSIDSKLLNNVHVRLPNKQYLDNIWAKIREYQARYLHEEKEFFAGVGLNELVNAYDKLTAKNDKLEENEIIVQLGWGTGYKVKTLKEGVPEELFTRIVRRFNMTRREDFPYPKTRKVIFRDGRPETVPGFIKLKFL
ncbi:type III-A CRISPR-associated RAMP protein Csm5 [Methylomusa anaerophila]|uniref:CRISPR system Cms protein Csm5 n=1 Tax=Methylomusa anaerophila TaxID=1930071 RepID=A0A348AR45_9FIRM|nr:type III-A CRISPR-associated RAMP protein Csm5 [Methylomusa anaerophila]BBB93543.1 RAMP superfamily protein [Methylomusa anaerophila]